MTAPSPTGSLFGRSRAEVEQALPDREPVECPVCRVAPRPFATDFQGLTLARCGRCGLQFQSPRPVFEQLGRAVYGDTYHDPAEAVPDEVRVWQFERQHARLTECLPPERRRLLDVGCGAGAFIRFARDKGWAIAGTDVAPTPWARETGVPIRVGQLTEIAFGSDRFDVVRFNHVLEHTQDPVAELRCAAGLVAPGGILLIGVPNLAGLSVRLKSAQSRLGLKLRRWKHYSALHHLWFFTPATLVQVVEAAGFQVVRWETPVAPRPRWPRWLSSTVRGPLELMRVGGILDLYARVKEGRGVPARPDTPSAS